MRVLVSNCVCVSNLQSFLLLLLHPYIFVFSESMTAPLSNLMIFNMQFLQCLPLIDPH